MNMLNIELARELQRDRDRMVREAQRARRRPAHARTAFARADRAVIRALVAAGGRIAATGRRWLSPSA